MPCKWYTTIVHLPKKKLTKLFWTTRTTKIKDCANVEFSFFFFFLTVLKKKKNNHSMRTNFFNKLFTFVEITNMRFPKEDLLLTCQMLEMATNSWGALWPILSYSSFDLFLIFKKIYMFSPFLSYIVKEWRRQLCGPPPPFNYE